MPTPTKAAFYVAYVALLAALLPYVAFLGIQTQGFHSQPKFYGWVMTEGFRIAFGYTVFGAAIAAVVGAVVGLLQRQLAFLPILTLLLSVGFLAYNWSPFTTVLCRAIGSAPSCLGS